MYEPSKLSNPLSVTFDSNVWESIADQDKLDNHADSGALKTIRGAIEAGRVTPYISDVVVTLEAIKKKDRQEFFRCIVKTTKRTEHVDVLEDGTSSVSRKIDIRLSFNHHPGMNEKLSAALESAIALGFRLINVPRIGWMQTDENLYKLLEADDEERKARIERTGEANSAFEAEGCGVAWVSKLSEEAIMKDPGLASRAVAPFLAFAYIDDQPRIASAVAEWADGDALAAHHGHQHDVFCTLDQGKGAGQQSVLHESRRQWLKEKFNIHILMPSELAAMLKSSEDI